MKPAIHFRVVEKLMCKALPPLPYQFIACWSAGAVLPFMCDMRCIIICLLIPSEVWQKTTCFTLYNCSVIFAIYVKHMKNGREYDIEKEGHICLCHLPLPRIVCPVLCPYSGHEQNGQKYGFNLYLCGPAVLSQSFLHQFVLKQLNNYHSCFVSGWPCSHFLVWKCALLTEVHSCFLQSL